MSCTNGIFPQLTGKWHPDIALEEYASLIIRHVKEGNPFLNPELFGEWITLLHKTFGVDYSYGGYMKNRELLLDGCYLPSGGKVHLGIDYWVPEGTEVHLPFEAKLVHWDHSNDQNGGWGGRVVFEYKDLFFIFGHLDGVVGSTNSIYYKGVSIGKVAGVARSGGWYPHLHLQCCKKFHVDVDGYSKYYMGIINDYPDPEGVLAVP